MIRALSNKQLAPFLKRHMQLISLERGLQLDAFLRLALEKAAQFVPSQSGSIFLDDPGPKMIRTPPPRETYLSVVACFGPKSSDFLGKRISSRVGIAGRVYRSGEPVFSRDVLRDPHFAGEVDLGTGFRTRSVLCVPIRIRESVIGVLELAGKKGKRPYDNDDFELLKIFADYISASIQNLLDARRNYEMAKRDSLTGLANDRQLFETLDREVRSAWSKKKNVGVLFLDLDGFKQVNDAHGHLAGSRVLVEVAEVLRQAIRLERAEIARYGGDEYVVVLPGVTLEKAVKIAGDIRRAIERSIFLLAPSAEVPALRLTGQLTASIGVACLWEHVGACDHGQLIRSADEAMYEAKHAGKNRVCVALPLAKSSV